jgi:hypothetical protein
MLSSWLKNVIHDMPDVTQCNVFVTNLYALSSGLSSWWWHFWHVRMVPVLIWVPVPTVPSDWLLVVCHSPSRPMPEWYIEIGHGRFIRIFRHCNRRSRYGAAKLYLHPMSFLALSLSLSLSQFGVLKELIHISNQIWFSLHRTLLHPFGTVC